jgi:uncharacterized iron-regulated protein
VPLDEIEHEGDAILAVKLLASLALVAFAGCAHVDGQPLAGRIWDTRASMFVPADALFARAAAAPLVILGETHDNPEHHRLQLVVLQKIATPARVLAMEQFDSQYQAAIDAARMRGGDAEAIADAGHFDRKGWNWALYKPLVQFALEFGWPLRAANLSRADARAIVMDPSRSKLPPADPRVDEALSRDIAEGHCGQAPEAKLLHGMVEAQRARDARLASAMKGDAVLISGAGHARRDRGVPLYVAGGDLLSIAFTEVEDGKTSPQEYETNSYDFLWFTSPAPREDPCAS